MFLSADLNHLSVSLGGNPFLVKSLDPGHNVAGGHFFVLREEMTG